MKSKRRMDESPVNSGRRFRRTGLTIQSPCRDYILLDLCGHRADVTLGVTIMLSSSRFVVAVHAMSVLARFHGQGARVLGPGGPERAHQSGGDPPADDGTGKGRSGALGGRALRRFRTEPRPGARSRWPTSISRSRTKTSSACTRPIPHSHCPVAAQLGQILSAPLRAAECALHSSLAKTSIRDVASAIV